MNSLRNILLAGLLLGCTAASAQPFERIVRRNFWNDGHNATGLRADSVTISFAELYGGTTHGGFRDFSDPAQAWRIGAVGRTITHLERISLAGLFSFEHAQGSGMSGSMFIRPGFYPVDALEFTPGEKSLQTYAFTGGIAADAAPRWRIGAKIEFTSQNYAKRKDLRHTNYRLDMTVAPGIMYHAGKGAVGANYLFRKNGETITAEELGGTVANYYAFLDKGLMFGVNELWTGSGVHLNEAGVDGFPLSETSHGAAVQATWGGFYAEAEYLHGAGRAGEKQTVWFEFPSHSVTVRAAWRFDGGGAMHFLRLRVAWSRQTNYENVLSQQTVNGVTTTNVLGSNRIFEREGLCVNPEYEATGDRGEFRGGAKISMCERLASHMYPYLFRQSIVASRVYASGMLHFGRFELRLGAAFFTGRLTEEEELLDGGIEAGDPPTRLTACYDLQNEYLSAPRCSAALSLRHNLRCGLYFEAAAEWTHGFDLRCIDGADRWMETLKIGYTF